MCCRVRGNAGVLVHGVLLGPVGLGYAWRGMRGTNQISAGYNADGAAIQHSRAVVAPAERPDRLRIGCARSGSVLARTGVVDDVGVGSADDVSGDATVGAVPRGTAGVLLDGGGRVLQRFFVVACQRAPPVSRRVI